MGLALDEPNGNTPVRIDDVDVLMEDQVKPLTEDQVLDYVVSSAGQGFILAPASGESCC